MAQIPHKFKRGDIRGDGRIFWRYDKNKQSSEIWVTQDIFDKKQSQQRSRLSKWLYKNIEKERERQRVKQAEKRKTEEGRLKCNEATRKWAGANKGRLNASALTRYHEKYKHDPLKNLKMRLRGRIRESIEFTGFKKKTKTENILGCSYSFFKSYLEQRFLPGMSWENRNLWHIDHIFPIASAKTEKEVIKLNHYTNLRPLWATDNLRKRDSIPEQYELLAA
jgi:hypothetical protein